MATNLDILSHFPSLRELTIKGIVYLDNAATTQKPRAVIDAMTGFYEKGYGNINRSAHPLGERATKEWENARIAIKQFVDCPASHELIFTHGATEASNVIASGLSPFLKKNSTVAMGLHDHHAQFVPWQQAAKAHNLNFLSYAINRDGSLDESAFDDLLTRNPSVVCFTSVSHVTGTKLSLQKLIAKAQCAGAITIVDGSQEVAHGDVTISDLGCDFYYFSAHKMYGPTGIGALVGRLDLLEKMSPLLFGGDMVEMVTHEHTSFAEIPRRFEAGTQPLAEAVGFRVACEFLRSPVALHALGSESLLTKKALTLLSEMPEIDIIGSLSTNDRQGIISFAFKGLHSHDVGEVLSRRGICARTGHFCAQPFMRSFDMTALIRVSLGIYSQESDIGKLVTTLKELASFTRRKMGAAA